MPDIMMRLGKTMLVIEGAMGTMLQRHGIPSGTCPELLNIVEPDTIEGIHQMYRMAGADCAVTNTFGASSMKLAEYGLENQVDAINREGVRLARAGGAPHILADIGPTGRVLSPLGDSTFDEVYDSFFQQAASLATESPDAFLLETFTDIAEVRCAVLACIEAAPHIPVIACVTLGQQGRMDLSGTDPATVAVILEAAGADGVGLNCGLGPEQMEPLAHEMIAATTLPVIVQPNAGLPQLNHRGETVYPGTAAEMGEFAARMLRVGIAAVGSCCGSSPSFTGFIADEISNADCLKIAGRGFDCPVIAGPRRTVEFSPNSVSVIGERINPTGKAELAQSLTDGDRTVLRRYATQQQAQGADALDINVGAPSLDQVVVLPAAVEAAYSVSDLPLVIDTTDPDALEAALRIYPGKALINSVNGDAKSMNAVLPLAKKYGACLVALTLDEKGIPATPEGRAAIAQRIKEAAAKQDISSRDLLVDTLVLTVAADPDAVTTTLESAQLVSESGLATMLGVSNVSHGLPMRSEINAAFVSAAADCGVRAMIINPGDSPVMQAVQLSNVRLQEGLQNFSAAKEILGEVVSRALDVGRGNSVDQSSNTQNGDNVSNTLDEEIADLLARAVTTGDSTSARELVTRLLNSGQSGQDIISEILTPAIEHLGDQFASGEIFLPQLIIAADSMKQAVDCAKSQLGAQQSIDAAKVVVFATVKGDIHSIGKDICVSLLEAAGYEVCDLGVDVAAEDISKAVQRNSKNVVAVGLSALMTTTLPAMSDTIETLKTQHPHIPICTGGAVVTDQWAQQQGARYSSDAPSCVTLINSLSREFG